MNTRTYLPSWREGDYKNQFLQKKYGGGVINELSHDSISCLLFGKPKAVFAKYFNSKSLEIDTEDIVNIIFILNKNIT